MGNYDKFSNANKNFSEKDSSLDVIMKALSLHIAPLSS